MMLFSVEYEYYYNSTITDNEHNEVCEAEVEGQLTGINTSNRTI